MGHGKTKMYKNIGGMLADTTSLKDEYRLLRFQHVIEFDKAI